MTLPLNREAEWLETDGWGGFASGTLDGVRSRRYHGLLVCATVPPSGRMMLLNGLEVWLETPQGPLALSSQRYSPNIVEPDGRERIQSFRWDPWPKWEFALPEGKKISQEFLMPRGFPALVAVWDFPPGDWVLKVRPLISGRDYHALQKENSNFRFEAQFAQGKVLFQPYPNVPGLSAFSNGSYAPDPHWFRSFRYEREAERGLDCEEDLASPGVFQFHSGQGRAALIFQAEGLETHLDLSGMTAPALAERIIEEEGRRRLSLQDPLERAGEHYRVRRSRGRTLVAGYPWFTDWGRDTFVALRGLALATGRLEEAGLILEEWSRTVSQGMIPNRFPEKGEWPEYNSVDASLWFGIAVFEYFQRCRAAEKQIPPLREKVLLAAVDAILAGYAMGTRYGIKLSEDGLLQAGEPGLQLTWMDAKIEHWVVTPRIGKPVEVQALWLNLLRMAGDHFLSWREIFERGKKSFEEKFWNPEYECLYDVVDENHVAGQRDGSLRPNQIFAVGGLPFPLITGARAEKIVDLVERHLLTPAGLRSLSFGDPRYHPRYRGGLRQRDASYHQGTAWPWLMGAFVEAWIAVKGRSPEKFQEARERFVRPLEAQMETMGLGHLFEIADGDPPHKPRGCPFQAWSLGELIRIKREILAPPNP